MAETDYYEVLVGWAFDDYADRVLLRLQSAHRDDGERVIEERRIMIRKDQAVLLANHMFQVSGHIPPQRKRPSFWRRLFAGS
ncbi:hypothetical protein WAB17_13210 [Parerythrobacter aurantius]|uniref:hypothetical protein n=1 Tax=Parerythrobacter aurantius TaxID=3127706 RepID=UPI00324B1F37